MSERWQLRARGGEVELIGRRPQHRPYLRIEAHGQIVTICHPATLRRLARLIGVALNQEPHD